MAVRIGKVAAVKVGPTSTTGTYVVSETGTYSLSGFSRDALESTAFGDDVKEYVFGQADGGEITFAGHYDPTDITGQNLIASYCSNGATLICGQLRFYVDNTSYLTVDTNGTILITKCKAIAFDKAGIGTIDFTAKLSGAAMLLV